MGVKHSVDKEFVSFVFDGENSLEEAEKAFREAYGEPSSPAARLPIILDARASKRHRDLNEVASLADSLGRYRKKLGNKAALVIDSSRPDSAGLEKRLAGFSLREGIEFGLFFDLESARAWLVKN